jgi:hypothetical protein
MCRILTPVVTLILTCTVGACGGIPDPPPYDKSARFPPVRFYFAKADIVPLFDPLSFPHNVGFTRVYSIGPPRQLGWTTSTVPDYVADTFAQALLESGAFPCSLLEAAPRRQIPAIPPVTCDEGANKS